MRRVHLSVILIGIPLVLAYGVLVTRQLRGSLALAEFKRLQVANPLDSLHPLPLTAFKQEMRALMRASQFQPMDSEPAYQLALLHLVTAEGECLSPVGPPTVIGSGPDPELGKLLRQGLQSIRAAIRVNPSVAEYHFVMALLLQNLIGASESLPSRTVLEQEVAAQLATSDKLDPFKPSLHFRIGSFYLALGNQVEAKKALSTALEEDPSLAKQVLPLLWSFTASAPEMRRLVTHDPRICVLLGDFLMDLGFREDAEAEYAEAALHGLKEYEVVSGLIQYYFRIHETDRALQLISQVERQSSFASPAEQLSLLYSAGLAHYFRGDLDAAVSSYRAALKIDDTRLQVHHALAEVFLKQEEYTKAIARWRFVLESDLDGRQPGVEIKAAHLGLGQAYEGQGRYAEALAEYLRAAQMDPHDRSIGARIQQVSKKM